MMAPAISDLLSTAVHPTSCSKSMVISMYPSGLELGSTGSLWSLGLMNWGRLVGTGTAETVPVTAPSVSAAEPTDVSGASGLVLVTLVLVVGMGTMSSEDAVR